MIKFNKSLASAAMVATMLASGNAYAFPVDFSDIAIGDALRALAAKSNVNVVVSNEIKGTVSMHMEDTTFEKALQALSVSGNFSYTRMGDTIIVSTQENLNTGEVFKLKHLDVATFKEQIEALLEDDDDAVIDEANNTISVVGTPAVLGRVKDMANKLDVARQQVNIRAYVIELSKGKSRSIGYNAGIINSDGKNPLGMLFSPTSTKLQSIHKPAEGGTFKLEVSGLGDNAVAKNGFLFDTAINHEDTLSNGRVLARPNVTVFDGVEAKVLMGDQVPVFTSSGEDDSTTVNVEYKDVGVNLDVTPSINDLEKGVITLKVKPSVSTITEWVESGNNKAPQISKREVETTVRVKAGETILIGGLLNQTEMKNMKGFPLLHKIPILGELFKSRSMQKNESELVIAITPTIIYDKDGVPQVQFQQLKPNLSNALNEKVDEDTIYSNFNVNSKVQRQLDEHMNDLEHKNGELESRYYGIFQQSKENELLKQDKKDFEDKLKQSQKEAAASKKEVEALQKERESLQKEREALQDELKKNNEALRTIFGAIRGGK